MQIDKAKEYVIDGFVFKNYIHLTDEERHMVLEWRNDDSVRYKWYDTRIVPYEEHLRFIESLKQRSDVYYWLVIKDNVPCGVECITSVDQNTHSCEEGYQIAPELDGSGYGFDFAIARLKFLDSLGIKSVYGAINEHNTSAILFIEYLGFVRTSYKLLEISGKQTIFYEYVCDVRSAIQQLPQKDLDGFITFYRKRIKELQR